MSNDPSDNPVPLDDREQREADAAVRRLAVEGFLALWHGERPPVAALCGDPEVVESQVRAGRLEVDGFGLLVGVHGLAARTTRHRIEHDGTVVHTWCALDAIGIPVALAADAIAVTSCPTCGAELRVVVRGGEPVEAPETFRLWLPEGRCDHLVEDFCDHANLYCSEGHLTATVPEGSPGRALTVAAVAAIGRPTWSDVAEGLGAGGGVRDG